MKRSNFPLWLVVIALTLIFQPAHAADKKLDLQKKPQLTITPAAATTVKPLQKPMKLTPAVQMRTKAPRVALPIRLQQINQLYNDMAEKASEYEVGTAFMPEIQKECAEKSYSVQDQVAAGCNGNETLNQCMEKLVHHCTETFSTSGISWGGFGGVPAGSTPTFSTQAFREAAEQTAEKARTLSQKLQMYAVQAERNAAAWK